MMTTQEIINKFVTEDSSKYLKPNILMGMYLGMEYVDDDPKYYPKGYFIDAGNDEISWMEHHPIEWGFNFVWNMLIDIVYKLRLDNKVNIDEREELENAIIDLDFESVYDACYKCLLQIYNLEP